ncbi:MAG: fibronectin, partial [Acidobacteria bacterium]|nr:fibronectin [Acidobacteriota bacterium]
MRGKIFLITSALALSILTVPQAEALGFTRTPSTVWFHTYASGVQSKSFPVANAKSSETAKTVNLETKSKFIVTYTGFPDDAKAAFQAAVDIWSDLFQSSVPIRINATWGRQASTVLGSTRPDFFYKNFVGAPARDLNYATALANALAGKDLDPARPDIIMTINSRSPFYTGTDGKPSPRTYDLESVVMHEIAHGLGFLTLASYDPFFGYGNIEDPTPFDAFTQLADGRRLMDLPSPSLELGASLTAPLYWAGTNGVAANNGNKPLLYTPATYEGGSSVSHLDEKTFSQSATDAAMTPNLDAGEVFRSPGPITLGMLEDMRTKPGAGIPVGLPEAPRNVKAIIGDKSAIVTFDPPANYRAAQVTSYL